MNRTIRIFFSGFLLTIFIGLNLWLPIQATRHNQAHAHHQATTHSSALCAWICASGYCSYPEGLEVPVRFSSPVYFEGLHPYVWGTPSPSPASSRGPPVLKPPI